MKLLTTEYYVALLGDIELDRLIKNYFYNILYQLFIIVVPLVTAPYLAKVLGAEQLGNFSYVNSVGNIICIIGLLGLNSYGNRQIAYFKEDNKLVSQIFSEIMILRIILCIIISVFYFIFSFKSEFNNLFILHYFLIVATFIDASWLLIGLEDMGWVVLRNFVAKLISVVCIFIFVKEPSDLWKYILANSLSTFFTTISLYSMISKYIHIKKVGFNKIIGLLKPTIQLFIPQVANLLYVQIGKIMLQEISNDSVQLAYYDQAEKIVLIPLAVITALSSVMMPRLASEYSKNNVLSITNYIRKVIEFSLFSSFPMVIGIAIISPKFIPWYLGESFIPVINVIFILCPLIVINALLNISSNQYFTATNQTKIMTVSFSLSLLLNIFLNYLFIPKYGYSAAAFSIVLSSLICLLVQYYYFSKMVKISDVLWHGKKYIIASIMMGGFSFLITMNLISSITTTLIQIASSVLIYLFILMITKDRMTLFLINKILSIIKN